MVDTQDIQKRIVEALKTVYDPEIPVNIHDLGLIYEVNVDETGFAHVLMTLTTPHCMAAQILPGEVEFKTKSVEGVRDARVDIVWDPPWTKDMISEAAKLQLGIY